nr:hypothetical protein Iba_chr03fCG2130 [Ipomoea batatas]
MPTSRTRTSNPPRPVCARWPQERPPSLPSSADMLGQKDGICKDLLTEVRPLQDPPPGFLSRLQFALEFLNPLIPLSEGLLERGNVPTVDFVPVFSSGKQAGHRVGHLQKTLNKKTELHKAKQALSNTSITGVVDPAPSRRGRLAVVTSSISRTSFSFPRFAARAVSWSPLNPAGCVAAKGRPVRTDASALGSAGRDGSVFFDPKLILVAGAGGHADTGKLLIVPRGQIRQEIGFSEKANSGRVLLRSHARDPQWLWREFSQYCGASAGRDYRWTVQEKGTYWNCKSSKLGAISGLGEFLLDTHARAIWESTVLPPNALGFAYFAFSGSQKPRPLWKTKYYTNYWPNEDIFPIIWVVQQESKSANIVPDQRIKPKTFAERRSCFVLARVHVRRTVGLGFDY